MIAVIPPVFTANRTYAIKRCKPVPGANSVDVQPVGMSSVAQSSAAAVRRVPSSSSGAWQLQDSARTHQLKLNGHNRGH